MHAVLFSLRQTKKILFAQYNKYATFNFKQLKDLTLF